MNNEAMNPAKKHFLLPLLIITLERNTQKDTIADLFIFLVQYSFLCNEPSSGDKILKRDVSYSGELSSQKSNGARYLDPKYSRWISVDPALGEYVPGAGKANTKDVGGLPGMGDVFNSVNLNLFHYAGNNPVKYSDPDGRIIQVEGDDKQIYIWDNERNDFYNKKTKAYETSDNYVNEIKKAMVYLKESDFAADVIKSLTEITGITEIKRSYANTYEAFNRTNIKFSVSGGLKLNDKSNSIHSPALGLFHEFSHSFSNLIEKK